MGAQNRGSQNGQSFPESRDGRHPSNIPRQGVPGINRRREEGATEGIGSTRHRADLTVMIMAAVVCWSQEKLIRVQNRVTLANIKESREAQLLTTRLKRVPSQVVDKGSNTGTSVPAGADRTSARR